MKMTIADQKAYPKMAYYVRVDLPQVAGVRSIVAALKKIGGVSKQTITNALRWNHGPEIKVTALVGAFGEFTPDSKSNEIRVDRKVVQDFEAGKGRRVAHAGGVYLLGVTLLHEATHWADDQDGVDRPGEEGEELEKLLYGNVIY